MSAAYHVGVVSVEVDPEAVGLWSAIGSTIVGALVGAYKLGRRQSSTGTTLEEVLEEVRCEAESIRETLREEGTATREVLHDMTRYQSEESQKTLTSLAILLDRTYPAPRLP